MGFPVTDLDEELSDTYTATKEKEKVLKDYAGRFTEKTHVIVDGKPVNIRVQLNTKGPYNITWLWDMTYRANGLTEFKVSYPMNPQYSSADGSGDFLKFGYITHTGAYWAKPIKLAIFEFDDPSLVKMIRDYPPGLYKDDRNNGVNVTWSITPRPYNVDVAKGRIVWVRRNWTPKKGGDDIEVDREWEYTLQLGPDGGIPDDFWCMSDDSGKPDSDLNKASSQILDNVTVRSLEANALRNGEESRDETPDFKAYAPHERAEIKSKFLRYLRNYMAARHGHVFQNEEMRSCFSDVKKDEDSWSATELANIKFIRNAEARANHAYRAEIAKLKTVDPATVVSW